VLHLDSYVQDNLVRSKLRFLSHLPLTANFRLGLVDLGSLNPPLSRGTFAALASEVAAEKKARATAARKQKELNKRTQALATRAREEEGINNPHARGNAPHEWQAAANFDATAFPDLANPLGFASGAPSVPDAVASGADSPALMSAAAGSPELRGRSGSGAPSSSSSVGSPATRVSNWNKVAEKGMASSELWAPLSASAAAAPAPASHWGASAAPLSSRPAAAGGSNPPALHLGSAGGGSGGGGGWGARSNKPAASSSSSAGSHSDEPDTDAYPQPSVNRHGQTTLLSTAGRRSYR
jgi:hypothetical protein